MIILCFVHFQITTSTAFPFSSNFLLIVLFTKSSVLSLSSFGSSLVLPIVVAGNDGLIEIKKEQKKGRKKERNLREAEFWLGCRESACMHCGSWPIQRDSLFSRASLCSREATGCHDSQKPRSHKWLHTSLCLALHCIWSWMVRMEAAIVNSPRKCPWCTHPTATVKLAPQLFCLSTADCACFSRTKLYMLYHMHMSLVNESFKKQSLSSSSSFLL